MRPESARQLFRSTVAPVVDYASVIWSPGFGQIDIEKASSDTKNRSSSNNWVPYRCFADSRSGSTIAVNTTASLSSATGYLNKLAHQTRAGFGKLRNLSV